MPTTRAIARKAYRTSPATYVEIARNKYGLLQKRRKRNPNPPVTREFLRSQDYQDLMLEHVPCTGEWGLHEAQTQAKSFLFRAHRVDQRLRAWRWRGVHEHLDQMLELIPDSSDNGSLVLDLGGAASPFGLGSVVVDLWDIDANGDEVKFHSLESVGRQADVILSSHTLEHIDELDAELNNIQQALKPGGKLVAFVPSYTCERWRAGWAHASHGDHVWTFGLSETKDLPEGMAKYRNIDDLVGEHLNVSQAEYCGDDSIFIVAEKR